MSTATSLPGIRLALAQTVIRVNHAYSQVPEEQWPPVDGTAWRSLEDRIDAATAAGDRGRALRAIEDWERHAVEALRGAVWS
jgi:hypothetical protein